MLHSGSVLDVVSGEVRTADVVVEGDGIADTGIGLDGDEGIGCGMRGVRMPGSDGGGEGVHRRAGGAAQSLAGGHDGWHRRPVGATDRAGADRIKVTATGSMAIGKGIHDLELTVDEMTALVDEARRQGGDGARARSLGRGARRARRAASIEHVTYRDQTAVEA